MSKTNERSGDLTKTRSDRAAKTSPPGDPALAQAFVDHQGYLKKYLARRLPADQDPEDFSQDVYLKALLFARRENNVENWPGILTRIAADMVTDGFRRRRSRAGDRHVALDAIEEPSDNILASPESILQGRQRITIVDETLKTLSSDCRRAFMLVRFYGYSYAEVASELGIKPVAVGRLIEQASSRVTKAAIGNA